MSAHLETVKAALEGNDAETLYGMMADDIQWSSTTAGEQNGKEAVKAFMEGMRAKMGDMRPTYSNWVAKDDSTICVDSEMDIPEKGKVCSAIEFTMNADGKCCKWTSTRK